MDRPPQFLFYQIYRGCNLRCNHCDFWKLKEHPDAQSPERIRQMVADFARLSEGRGSVVTCGGEPTLAKEKYWALCGEARAQGLRMLSVQNGTRIKTLDDARKTLLEGPHETTISLDGPVAEMHDRFRGAKGSFAVATRAVRLLVQAREELGLSRPESMVNVQTIFCGSLKGRLREFYDFVLGDLKADKLKLTIMFPTFNHPDREGFIDPYFEAEHIQDIDAMLAELAESDRAHGIPRNPVWIEQVRMYHQSVALKRAQGSLRWSTVSETTRDRVCDSMERNIMVNDLGLMRLCFHSAFPGEQYTDYESMRAFWYESSEAWRGDMRACKRLCGMSHSQRNSRSLLRV